jgi:hypothetical protein
MHDGGGIEADRRRATMVGRERITTGRTGKGGVSGGDTRLPCRFTERGEHTRVDEEDSDAKTMRERAAPQSRA